MADIRPMNFGEILDGSLMIYRRHFVLFLKLALVALSVPVVLFVYVGLRAFGDLRALGDLTNALRTLLYLVPVVIVYYAATLVLTAGTIRIISDSYLGRDPRLHDALALGLSKILPLDRKSTRLNSSHGYISYAVFCLKKKNKPINLSVHA